MHTHKSKIYQSTVLLTVQGSNSAGSAVGTVLRRTDSVDAVSSGVYVKRIRLTGEGLSCFSDDCVPPSTPFNSRFGKAWPVELPSIFYSASLHFTLGRMHISLITHW